MAELIAPENMAPKNRINVLKLDCEVDIVAQQGRHNELV